MVGPLILHILEPKWQFNDVHVKETIQCNARLYLWIITLYTVASAF